MKKTIPCLYQVLLMLTAGITAAQTNTASNSGSIGKCGVWDYPYTLYNNAGASQIVNDGVTVTVDQNRNIGAVNLSGSGAMAMSGANGITFSGSGGDLTCRWDINKNESHTVVNNDNHTGSYFQNWGTFFTAPYSGSYLWMRESGWSASLSGSAYNGSVSLFKNNSKATSSAIFYQNQPGSCSTAGTLYPPTWNNGFALPGTLAGETFQYGGGTLYASSTAGGACPYTTLNATVGNAVILYDN